MHMPMKMYASHYVWSHMHDFIIFLQLKFFNFSWCTKLKFSHYPPPHQLFFLFPCMKSCRLTCLFRLINCGLATPSSERAPRWLALMVELDLINTLRLLDRKCRAIQWVVVIGKRKVEVSGGLNVELKSCVTKNYKHSVLLSSIEQWLLWCNFWEA